MLTNITGCGHSGTRAMSHTLPGERRIDETAAERPGKSAAAVGGVQGLPSHRQEMFAEWVGASATSEPVMRSYLQSRSTTAAATNDAGRSLLQPRWPQTSIAGGHEIAPKSSGRASTLYRSLPPLSRRRRV